MPAAEVVDGEPPGGEAQHHGVPRRRRVVEAVGVPGAGVLDEGRARGAADLLPCYVGQRACERYDALRVFRIGFWELEWKTPIFFMGLWEGGPENSERVVGHASRNTNLQLPRDGAALVDAVVGAARVARVLVAARHHPRAARARPDVLGPEVPGAVGAAFVFTIPSIRSR